MDYYFSPIVKGNFDRVIKKTTELLQKEGFSILTQIDIQKTPKLEAIAIALNTLL